MQIGPKSLARALEVRKRVDEVATEVQNRDNVKDVDSDDRSGNVVVSREAMTARGQTPIQVPTGNMYKDEVEVGHVQFDTASKKTSNADITCKQFYDSSYGRSAEDVLQYRLTEETDKSGNKVLVYQQKRDVYYNDRNSIETVKVDVASGDVLSYKGKEYGLTMGQGLKEMFTTLPGIGLMTAAGLLCGVPGSLGYALFGPVAGVAAAGAVAIGFAYAKTRPSNPVLPQHNQ